ncbi:hypothetical protein [Azotobacter beijerinckii]|uniref:Uncharacterized protein n=1 Tax=Azotobacter beijerinckii TaxID=170623 RepID=A0A1I4G3R5_9GAMM|nr:hypothetical protein [Azotobacter beijerinckii]SFL23716.1 hypothetical protein SAMN04244574_03636 [Azotobacter beijerinckii]
MVQIVYPRVLVSQETIPPLRTVNLRFLRDGDETGGYKKAKLFDGPDNLNLLAVFQAFDGVTTLPQRFLASALPADLMVLATDMQAPKIAKAAFVVVEADGEILMNISNGANPGGAHATVSAVVRVDQQAAAREVVVLERPSDGVWRVAGYGSTPGGGGEIALRVSDGLCYALAIDDYGTLYQPTLAVAIGDVIRPTLIKGWLYRITQAGILPASEPAWWDGNLAGPQDLGTARAEVVRYYRPLAHGPITVETT